MAAATVRTPLLPISGSATAAPTPAAVETQAPWPLQQPHHQPLQQPLEAVAPVSARLQCAAINAFSLLRCLRGVSLVAYPAFGLYALDIPPDGSSFMLTSLIGVRDILLAGLLYTSDTPNLHVDAGARREVARSLAATLLSDAMDTFVLIFYAAWSDDWGNPLAVIIITAVMAMCEHLTLWSMSEDEWHDEDHVDHAEHYNMEEDKQMRMNAWLRELEFTGRYGRGQSRAASSRARSISRAASMSQAPSTVRRFYGEGPSQMPQRDNTFYV